MGKQYIIAWKMDLLPGWAPVSHSRHTVYMPHNLSDYPICFLFTASTVLKLEQSQNNCLTLYSLPQTSIHVRILLKSRFLIILYQWHSSTNCVLRLHKACGNGMSTISTLAELPKLKSKAHKKALYWDCCTPDCQADCEVNYISNEPNVTSSQQNKNK